MIRFRKWRKNWNTLSWLITIYWNWRVKIRNQSPDFERDQYYLGQDHGGTPQAAELFELLITRWYTGNKVITHPNEFNDADW